MKYLFCTISIGKTYFDSAIKFAESLNKFSKNHHMLIITDLNPISLSNTTINKIPSDKVIRIKDSFNYMLKYYPLEVASKMEYDYVIFVDSDWRVRNEYNSGGIENMLKFMDENGLDLLFERPHNIGAGKHNLKECFWEHKIDFYKLNETNEYDEGHVCNEQFLVFKNNEKFKLFVDKFAELYKISTEGELWPFAEGLEMGMSMAYAKMKFSWVSWERFVKGMFEFNSRDGGLNIRF